MKRFTQWSVLMVCILCISFPSFADHLSAKYLFAARMNGAQEVPAVSTNALGLGTFYVSENRDTVCLEMTATGLTGAITGVHIHQGAIGTNGPVALDLQPFLNGTRVKATLTGAAVTPALLTAMFSGMFYLNVHTAAHPNGEIRGQILPEEDKGMAVMLSGAEQVPAVLTTAMGTGSFVLAKQQNKLSFNVVVDGLSGPITGAHLHQNAAGNNGPVVQDLMMFISGNKITGSVDPTSFLSALMHDSIYINIHTTLNPNGEIRSQLLVQPYLHLDARMDTAQEATMVMSDGDEIGHAAFSLNYTFDTLWYDVQATGLTGPIQAAHFHSGAVNVSGPVVIGIPSGDINNNRIAGYVAAPTLTNAFIKEMMEGNIYLNIHTAANPNGEIRGQVYRTFREGYTFHINGAQESPMVNSNASGTGMVSVNREQTSAHYMMVVNGLNAFTGAHFHKNVAGQNGAVIYDITSMYNNGGIFGYWTEADMTTPFNASFSNLFRKDSVYVNYHTSPNPNGEIRGNSTRNLCNVIPTSIRTLDNADVISKLYPNPTSSVATLDLMLSAKLNATIQLSDITGRTVWTKEAALSAGANRINIPMAQMSPGIYFIKVMSEGAQLSYKVIKQ